LVPLGEVALVDVLTSGRNVGRIVSPAVVTDAESFVSRCLASGVNPALDTFARSFAGRCWRFTDEPSLAFAAMAPG